jgi:acyl-CoA thioesterase FadM
VFSVVALEAHYQRAARLDDQLVISSEPGLDGPATLRFRQRIWRDSEHGELLLTASVRVACLAAATLRPRRLPAFVTECLREAEG